MCDAQFGKGQVYLSFLFYNNGIFIYKSVENVTISVFSSCNNGKPIINWCSMDYYAVSIALHTLKERKICRMKSKNTYSGLKFYSR